MTKWLSSCPLRDFLMIKAVGLRRSANEGTNGLVLILIDRRSETLKYLTFRLSGLFSVYLFIVNRPEDTNFVSERHRLLN